MSQLLNARSPRTRHTRTEFQSLPEGPPYFELIDGEFVDVPRPGRAHAAVAVRLLHALLPHADAAGGELTFEPNLYLPGTDDVLHPDLLYLAAEHLTASRSDGVYGVPDLVIEVLSPSTERKDRTTKRRVYQRAGVPNLWLVDPVAPVLIEAFELVPGGEFRLTATVQAPETWRPRLFPGCTIALAELEGPRRPVD